MRIPGIVAFTLLVGCGGGGGSSPDASSPDATPIDATPPMVRVTVHGLDGNPASGSQVVFEDPAGTVLSDTTSDANGQASAPMPDGGSVHAVLSIDANNALVLSVLSVVDGDDLSIGAEPPMTSAGTFAVTVPVDALATSYEVDGPCGPVTATGVTATLSFDSTCVASTIDLLAIAKDAGGNAIGYLFAPAVAFTSGGSTTLSGSWTAPDTFSATYSNIPTNDTVRMFRRAPTDRGYITGSNAFTGGPSASFGGPMPVTPNAFVSTDVATANGTSEHITQQIAGSDTAYAFDASTMLLPELDVPSLDVPSWSIAVGHTGSGTVDAILAHVVYGDGTNGVDWYIYTPDTQSIAIPILPASAGFAAFQASDNVNAVVDYEVASPGVGWDGTRPDLVHAFDINYRVEQFSPGAQAADVRIAASPIP